MNTPLDIAVVVLWLTVTLGIGLWFRKMASQSTDHFFVANRSLPWWVVGTSMVATTFAADTPLAVAGYVAAGGIDLNWRWWFTGLGAICTVFLFAPLWRRSAVITDAELVEFRYGGPAAKWLRGAKAIWFGLFLNILVIAWVMKAMHKVSEVIFGLNDTITIASVPVSVIIVLGLFVLAVVYTSSAGLFGVIATDLLQFLLAMTASIALAILSWNQLEGREGIINRFAEHGFDWSSTTTLIPIGAQNTPQETTEFLLLIGVVWWSAKNVDGGSYLAQRMLSAKDDRHASWGYLWFAIANLCLRPWPWIVVGLAGMALIGPIDDPELYYPMMMTEVLPPGLFGLMVAAFLAAFMSTIDTQLHWGTSLLAHDVYRRFLNPQATDAHVLHVSRWIVVGLAFLGALASFAVDDIRFAWELALSVTAGLGAVFIARWFWWRVNAFSEWTAMLVAMACTGCTHILRAHHPALTSDTESWMVLSNIPAHWLSFPFDAAWTVLFSIPIWLLVTFLTPPSDRAHLEAFCAKVRPSGPGWTHITQGRPELCTPGPDRWTLVGLLSGVAMIYGGLLGVGAFIVGLTSWGWIGSLAGVLGAFGVFYTLPRELDKATMPQVSGDAS